MSRITRDLYLAVEDCAVKAREDDLAHLRVGDSPSDPQPSKARAYRKAMRSIMTAIIAISAAEEPDWERY